MRWWWLLGIVSAATGAYGQEYDPLRLPAGYEARSIDLAVSKGDREIPIRVYLPPAEAPKAASVVLYSHGLGGSRETAGYLGRHWAGRGYVAVFLQHPGSDESVWMDQPAGKRMAAMREAASAKNFMLRAQDVPAVLDQLAKWNGEDGHALAGRLDLQRVGMSGHSFGGQTTQALAGQSFPPAGPRLADARIRAAIVMSPSAPERGDLQAAFGKVATPWLLMTGTLDAGKIGGQTVESRRSVFPALAAGHKYELVLDQAEHSVFTERALAGEQAPRNPNHHRVILALSTAFWDAYVNEDRPAREWLEGTGPRGVMEDADQWQRK